MQMSIGNAPWPVGVTRSGIHQRPGSSKAYVSNIAHVLNDETQRRYIHAVKRYLLLGNSIRFHLSFQIDDKMPILFPS